MAMNYQRYRQPASSSSSSPAEAIAAAVRAAVSSAGLPSSAGAAGAVGAASSSGGEWRGGQTPGEAASPEGVHAKAPAVYPWLSEAGPEAKPSERDAWGQQDPIREEWEKKEVASIMTELRKEVDRLDEDAWMFKKLPF
eukprot:TRINITY_DN13516_c0_g1_i1.p1 TRINITY_DN13516_c0_g1~~TRINITY_DN13516_c0_g1_i1.p1  ORF type:complete len:139 (-),score=31.30 TRINITY_DN13516_c0_g1_i1:190-606(-)